LILFPIGTEKEVVDFDESTRIIKFLSSKLSGVKAMKNRDLLVSLRGSATFADEKEKDAYAEKLRRWSKNYALKTVDVRLLIVFTLSVVYLSSRSKINAV
jgi:hypothetical protein